MVHKRKETKIVIFNGNNFFKKVGSDIIFEAFKKEGFVPRREGIGQVVIE